MTTAKEICHDKRESTIGIISKADLDTIPLEFLEYFNKWFCLQNVNL